ncbi:MAG: AAA family ATPase [Caldilineaceae bacterium]|nr:AAA family ATPase [Caldilineaceae bacterium]
MRQVAERLPSPIRDYMETEARLFSRFLKNDFGQGGAWPHYWGAFYPKGSSRSRAAQLIMSINYRYLECGFYIGNYGTDYAKRFERNCAAHASILSETLAESIGETGLLFGSRGTFKIQADGTVTQERPGTLDAFLRAPSDFHFDVSHVIPARELLQLTEEELVARVAQVHARLFPLVLLAIHDDPLPAIAEYLGIDQEDEEQAPQANEAYSLDRWAAETGFAAADLARWVRALRRKRQVIFYGPPGTGKTFVAQKLAQHLIGGGRGFMEIVQFHPAYAYEDFVQGIRPRARADGGLDYPVKAGRFLEFCRKAEQSEDPCVLIIDEINRANLARVFGELMYLLEYRDREIPLAAGDRPFRIPDNVYIVGTMNTADRSIALVDHALRRRFAFLALRPNYDVLKHYHVNRRTGFPVERLTSVLKDLNQQIADHHYEVGISYFLHENAAADLADIWQMEIEPYLEELFFDNPERAKPFQWSVIESRIFSAEE